MGDANNINLGANAQARQVAAGSDITQIIIENFVARAPRANARFSLPRAPENFTGRADEIETLVNALTRDAQGAARGAALTGVSGLGGIGKSALAAVAAQRVAENFPDAQLWLNLRGTDQEYAKPSDVMREIIFALDPETGAALKDASDAQIAQVYRSILSAQRALIVLDNARDNAQVRPLLQAHATFLVTSRANLTEGGLHALRLGVMHANEAEAYVLSLCPRLQTADNKSPTTELCQVCGYLPLALKIAGSYLAARPNVRAENYVEQLKRARLALLREGAEAEANVEATFSQTYAQLTLTQQILFDALSVFPAPFTLQAAAYVWGLGEIQAEAALGELIRASFVEFETADKATETGDRYFLHDLLREFGAARQTDANRRQTAKRHAEFYEQVARAATELYLQGNEKILAGLRLFDDELPHMRAGQAYAAANMDRDDDAARLCSAYPGAAAYVANLRLPVREWIRWLEQALNAARKLGNRSSEGVHLGNLGLAYADLGEARQAIAFYEQVLSIIREIGDRRGEGNALGNLGNAYAALGEARQAIAFYEQALAIARDISDKRNEGNWLGNLGLAYAALGETRRAIAFYEQALSIIREIGDRRGEGNSLGNLGNAYADLGDARQAIAFYEQRIAIAREIGDRRGEGNALGNLGLAYADLGEARQAIAFYEQQLVIAREIGDRRGEGNALGNLGLAYADLGDARQAIVFYEKSLAIKREIGEKRAEGSILGNLGSAYFSLDDARQAIAFYEQHLVIAREIGDRRGEGADLGNLGLAYADLGDARQAIAFYEQHLVIAREIGDRRGEGNALGNLGNAYADFGDARQAIAFYEKSLAIKREIGDRRGEGNSLANMGWAYKELGDANKAKTLWRAALEIYEAIEDPNAKRLRGWLEE